MKNWYSISNKSENVVDISIHDEIGLWGVNAADFINELRSHPDAKSINLSIHSPGGNVLDGLAMYNALIAHPAKIYGHVEGLAASAASFILMASDSISMPEDSFIMIHNAWGGAMGDAEDLRDMADVIDKLQDSIVNIYSKRTEMDESELRAMMNAETWLNATDALKYGFTDTVTDKMDVAAKINVFSKHFKEMPVNTNNGINELETIKDFERYLRDAGGFSNRLAKALTSQAKVIFPRDVEDDPSQDYTEAEAALTRLDSLFG